MGIVKTLAAERPVVIFSKSSCGLSHSIKTLIRNFGANPMVYELDELPNGQKIERELLELGCHPSVPAVFIGSKLVGGANEVTSLNIKGKLKPMLIKVNAIWV